MARFLKIAAIPTAGFCRAGRFWPHEGVTIPVTDLTEADLDRIIGERQLNVQPATGEEADPVSDEDLAAALKTAIGQLEAGDFDKGGEPKLDALRAALPAQKDRITAELRDAIWAELKPDS